VNYEKDTIEASRVAFILQEMDNHPLIRKKLKYPAPNPCTIVDDQN
jgi:hypothetical protein